MRLALEFKKLKRSGLLPAFLGGGLLAAALPVINMALRRDAYANITGSPVSILLEANWQMMALLDLLLIALGGCILYNIEYADRAMEKLRALPVRESSLFFSKAALLALSGLMALAIQWASLLFCSVHWFRPSAGLCVELLESLGASLLLSLPAVLLALLIASACRSMWISLGLDVICVFTAVMIPTRFFALTLFPFALPFQLLLDKPAETVRAYMAAAAAEIFLLSAAEIIFLKIRRSLE